MDSNILTDLGGDPSFYREGYNPVRGKIKDLGGIPIDYQHQNFVKEIHRLTGEGVDAFFDRYLYLAILQRAVPGRRVVDYGLTGSLPGGRLATDRPGARHYRDGCKGNTGGKSH